MRKLRKVWKVILPAAVVCASCGIGFKIHRNNVLAEEKAAAETAASFTCALKAGSEVQEYAPDTTLNVLSLVEAGNGKYTYQYEQDQTISGNSDFSVTAEPDTIDLSVPSETEVIYTLHDVDAKGNKVSKDFPLIITVKDTQLPVITMSSESVSIEKDQDFDPASLISSVKDPVDGDLIKVDTEPAKNEKGFYDSGWYTISGNVDATQPGEYTVTVHAVDKNGNDADASAVVSVVETVQTVQQASSQSVSDTGANTAMTAGDTGNENLNSIADSILSGIINDSMDDYQRCYAIYQWTENNIRYKATPDSSDWREAAIYGLTYYTGDCYNYYAVGRALLCRAGFETQECKLPNDGHFWVKVLYNGQWLNWDATTGWGAERFLWTDDQLYSYSYTNPSSGYTISYNY
ncbi:transglutaminase domain-containing protein [Lactimicrobium massiliense]|uniref:transglutaminase domain-containing protein n=1 Tax=Lactimicrobium massiliense TaxID=2161814 RepID=UPI000D54F0D5|nr:transglutaminase domain-containing protein [Lactimicrobium massiliense]